MSPFFAVIIFIALNIIPADVSVFEIVCPQSKIAKQKVILFTRQKDGRWHMVEPPRDELGTATVDGTKLKIAPPADERKIGNTKEMVMDMNLVLNLPKTLDWSKVTRIPLKPGGAISIVRKTNEVSVSMSVKRRGKSRTQNFIIRWKTKKQ